MYRPTMVSRSIRKTCFEDNQAHMLCHYAVNIIIAPANKQQKISDLLDTHGMETLSVYALPEPHRTRMRTTNMLERFNQEIKRRTRVVRIFPNEQSCIRLVSALAMEANEVWMERIYLDMEYEESLHCSQAGRELIPPSEAFPDPVLSH